MPEEKKPLWHQVKFRIWVQGVNLLLCYIFCTPVVIVFDYFDRSLGVSLPLALLWGFVAMRIFEHYLIKYNKGIKEIKDCGRDHGHT
jgi:hypothetical protein